MDLTTLKAKKAKQRQDKTWTNVEATVYEHAEYTEIRIPRVISNTAVRASATEKAVPMVSITPKMADGKAGQVYAKLTIEQAEDQVAEDGTVLTPKGTREDFSARINTFNLFL